MRHAGGRKEVIEGRAELGAALRALRERRSMALRDVEIEAGIDRSALSRIESGKQWPTVPQLHALGLVYRIPVDEKILEILRDSG